MSSSEFDDLNSRHLDNEIIILCSSERTTERDRQREKKHRERQRETSKERHTESERGRNSETYRETERQKDPQRDREGETERKRTKNIYQTSKRHATLCTFKPPSKNKLNETKQNPFSFITGIYTSIYCSASFLCFPPSSSVRCLIQQDEASAHHTKQSRLIFDYIMSCGIQLARRYRSYVNMHGRFDPAYGRACVTADSNPHMGVST